MWSELGEARKKEFFEGARTFPHDHPGVLQTVKRLLGSHKFSLDRGEYRRMFEDVTRWRKACPGCAAASASASASAIAFTAASAAAIASAAAVAFTEAFKQARFRVLGSLYTDFGFICFDP